MNQIPSLPTSPSLIMRAQSLDQVAWERLSKLYTPLVYGWVKSRRLQENDAADVVQDVFQAVAKSITKFDMGPDTPPFRAWLWGITRHKIKDHFRKKANTPNAFGGTNAHLQLAEMPESEPENHSDPMLLTDKDSLAYRALELMKTDFKPKTWQAFWQTTIGNRAAADVAADLQMSVGSVYTAKSRVLTHLRNELAGLT